MVALLAAKPGLGVALVLGKIIGAEQRHRVAPEVGAADRQGEIAAGAGDGAAHHVRPLAGSDRARVGGDKQGRRGDQCQCLQFAHLDQLAGAVAVAGEQRRQPA